MGKSMATIVWVQNLYNFLFFTAIFLTRDIDQKFSFAKELRMVCIYTTLFTSLYCAQLIFSSSEENCLVQLGFGEYLLVFMSLAMLYFTALKPVLKSYLPSKILPFSMTSQCLKDVESTMI
jgi:hypothetical protein